MAIEHTLVLIKPDAVAKRVVGEIVSWIERQAELLEIVELALFQMTPSLAAELYAEHEGKAFFGDLVAHMSSGPIVALVLRGEGAVRRWREAMGPVDSRSILPERRRAALLAEPIELVSLHPAHGNLRAAFCDPEILYKNALHGSDSAVSAAREIDLLFGTMSTFGEREDL